MNRKIEISERSIILAVLFPLLLAFLWLIHDILFSLLIAFILTSALRPIILFLVDRKWPRVPSTFLVFFGFILTFLGLVFIIVPPIVNETTAFVKNFPAIVQSLNPEIRKYIDVNSLVNYLPNVTNNIFRIIGSVFSNFLFVLSTLFFALYFLLEDGIFERTLSPFMPAHRVAHLRNISTGVEKRLTSWFWGQITLMTVIGTITYIALTLVGVRYALPLAVLAGFLEIVPNLGPILASIPAIIIGLDESYILGFSILAIYFIIQQLENALVVPFIMKRAVGVSPVLTLFMLLVGGKIGGVLGVLLAIPLLIIIEAVSTEILAQFRKDKKTKHEIQTTEGSRKD